MKKVLLCLVLLVPQSLLALEAQFLCPNGCEKIGPAPVRSTVIEPLLNLKKHFQLATVFGTDTRKVVKAPKTTRWPFGRNSHNEGSATGFFVSPCLYITAYHAVEDSKKQLLTKVMISNETDADGKYINAAEAEVIKVPRPPIDPTTGKYQADLDKILIRDPLCRGRHGYIQLVSIPASGENLSNDLLAPGFTFEDGHKFADSTNLVSHEMGCNLKYKSGYKIYHDCPTTEGSSGGPLLITSSTTNPERSVTGANIWFAAGMNIQYPIVAGSETCNRATCNVGVDADSILEFAGKDIEDDIQQYLVNKTKNLISSSTPEGSTSNPLTTGPESKSTKISF